MKIHSTFEPPLPQKYAWERHSLTLRDIESVSYTINIQCVQQLTFFFLKPHFCDEKDSRFVEGGHQNHPGVNCPRGFSCFSGEPKGFFFTFSFFLFRLLFGLS